MDEAQEFKQYLDMRLTESEKIQRLMFSELDKRLDINNDLLTLKFEAIACKNQEQDAKIERVEIKVDKVITSHSEAKATIMDKILDKVISWAVPFVFGAVLWFIINGGPGL